KPRTGKGGGPGRIFPARRRVPRSRRSEGQIVVLLAEAGAHRSARGSGLMPGVAVGAGRSVRIAGVPPPAEKHHLLHDDRSKDTPLGALLAVVAVLDAALDVHAGALGDVLLDDLGELAEEGETMPVCLLLLLAIPRSEEHTSE